jgi:hypothetical protein
MSNLLQRLIDRIRAPLSAVQPILPSIYTPADRSENDAGPMIQTEVAESAAQSSQFSPRQSDKRESSDAAPPMSGRPVETRASPATPEPPHRETDAPPHASQQTTKPAPPGQDASLTPPIVEKNFRPSVAPPPLKAKLSATEKAKDEGTVTKTFVPQGFGSKMAKSSAKREDTGSISGTGKSGLRPDVHLRQNFEGQAPGIDPNLPSAPTKSPESKAVLPTGPDAAAKINPNKTMPSLAATMKWIDSNPARSIENDAPAKVLAAARSEAPEPPDSSTKTKTSVPRDSETASPRENRDAEILASMSGEAFSTRQTENPASKRSQGNNRGPPVEVNVAIGHIEIKSVQPNPPAPRRPPQRPRFTLDEFLKHPHAGGPR